MNSPAVTERTGFQYRCICCGQRTPVYSTKQDYPTCLNPDCRWQALEDEADRLTLANKVELERAVMTNEERGVEAMEAYLDNLSTKEIARLLWKERQYELADAELSKPNVFGVVMIDRTELAHWWKQAAKEYADDNAERVSAEDLHESAVANEYDDRD